MWELRSSVVTAPLTEFTFDTRVWTKCPCRLGSKRTTFRASVFGTHSSPFDGLTETSNSAVPTWLTVRMTVGVAAVAPITNRSLSGSVKLTLVVQLPPTSSSQRLLVLLNFTIRPTAGAVPSDGLRGGLGAGGPPPLVTSAVNNVVVWLPDSSTTAYTSVPVALTASARG